jgi:hypothetical protein
MPDHAIPSRAATFEELAERGEIEFVVLFGDNVSQTEAELVRQTVDRIGPMIRQKERERIFKQIRAIAPGNPSVRLSTVLAKVTKA